MFCLRGIRERERERERERHAADEKGGAKEVANDGGRVPAPADTLTMNINGKISFHFFSKSR